MMAWAWTNLSAVPMGLEYRAVSHRSPALKHWAILSRPSGTPAEPRSEVLLRLPVDLLLLSLDFRRLLLWLVCRRARMLVGWPLRSWGPYCQTARTVSTQEPACPAARKYGTLAVFRLLCPYARSTDEGERFCTFSDALGGDYALPPVRCLGLGASLAILWVGVGIAAVNLPRSHPLSPRLLARLRERPDDPVGQVAPKPVPVPPVAKDEGQVKEAIAAYERLARDKPELYEASARLAWLLTRTGRTNGGVAVASALVREKRGHVLGHFVLAQTYHAKGFHDQAIEHCDQALATDRAHVETRVLLARCYLAKKQHDDAVRELKRVLRTSPKHAAAQMLLAKCYLDLKQYDKAKERYEKVAEENPETATPYLGLARIHVVRGVPEAALLCYEEALKRSPGDLMATNSLVVRLLELGRDLDRAHQLTTDLRKRFPESPIFADTHGWVCYHRGEYQKVIESLAFAAKRLPWLPELRYHYGRALYKAGKTGRRRRS